MMPVCVLCVCTCVCNLATQFLSINSTDDTIVMQNKQIYVCAIFTHVCCHLYSGSGFQRVTIQEQWNWHHQVLHVLMISWRVKHSDFQKYLSLSLKVIFI